MKRRLGLLTCFSLSWLLTGCPLTDPYQLLSDLAGAPGAGAIGSAGAEPTAGAHAAGHSGAASAGSSGTLAELGGTGDSGGSSGTDGGRAAGDAGAATLGGGSGGGMVGSGGIAGTAAGGPSGSSGELSSSGDAGASGTLGTSGGAGTGGSAGALSCSTPCTGSLSCCSATCVDTTSSAQHCGGCGKTCNQGRSCAASACSGGWISMKAPPVGVVARSRAASVAMGKSAVFIWGGLDAMGAALDNGLIYKPKTDSWVTLPKDTGSPSARSMATAVWTGSVVVLYGGVDANGAVLKDGAVYDPGANSWTALPIPPPTVVISRRSAPFGYYDGTHAVFWGGVNAMGLPVAGADRFDLTGWSVSTSNGDPGAISFAALAFDGSALYLQGGVVAGVRQDRVYSYSNSTDKWTALPKSLSPRSGAFAAWDGARFVVWGGRDDAGLRNDGKYLSGATWTNLSAFGAPSARSTSFRRSGWSFQVRPGVVAVLGGQSSLQGTGILATGGATYDVALAQWVAIPDWPSSEWHEYGVGVWTGEEFVLWGGRDANVPTQTGERWAPP